MFHNSNRETKLAKQENFIRSETSVAISDSDCII